jgi:hypothetical protein
MLPLRKLLLKELGYNYHKVPFSLGKIPYSLRKLLLKELGWGYHLIPFSLWKLLPRATWLNLPSSFLSFR